jgi:hypothetical protein
MSRWLYDQDVIESAARRLAVGRRLEYLTMHSYRPLCRHSLPSHPVSGPAKIRYSHSDRFFRLSEMTLSSKTVDLR